MSTGYKLKWMKLPIIYNKFILISKWYFLKNKNLDKYKQCEYILHCLIIKLIVKW
jgi:hypothetical protein